MGKAHSEGVGVCKMNEANVGYLPAMILKEIKAGRSCEITGGIVAYIGKIEDYEQRKDRLLGKFGEIIQWTEHRKALIATRPMPSWAIKILDAHINEAPEMERWRIE